MTNEGIAHLVGRVWAENLRCDPEVSVSQWAETHRSLGYGTGARPGRYSLEQTPYLREILDALHPWSGVRRVAVMKSVQVGMTEMALSWLAFVLCRHPGPTLFVLPRVEDARHMSQARLDDLFTNTPPLAQLAAQAEVGVGTASTIFSRIVPGGNLVLTGANAAASFRRLAAQYVLLDEVDAYPTDVENEGDVLMLAEARTATFGKRAKMCLISTPTMAGQSRIEAEYRDSDQRAYFVPCPHCNQSAPLSFGQLKWDWGRPRSVVYECPACGSTWPETIKVEQMRKGAWRPTASEENARAAEERGIRGYHLSALYAPPTWRSWTDVAALYEAACATPARRKAFYNTVLGLPWDPEAPEFAMHTHHEIRGNTRIRAFIGDLEIADGMTPHEDYVALVLRPADPLTIASLEKVA